MKINTFFAAALLLCACSQVKTDLDKYGLNCKAEEITLQSDTLDFPYTVRFNPDGQVLQVWFDSMGKEEDDGESERTGVHTRGAESGYLAESGENSGVSG